MMRCLRRAPVIALLCLLGGQAMGQSIDVYSRPRQTEPSRDFDVIHYRIELELDDATRSFWGTTTLSLRSLRESLTQVRLDAETFVVGGVTDAEGRALDFGQEGGSLRIRLAEPRRYGEELRLTVGYRADDVDIDPVPFGMSASYDLGIDFKAATRRSPALVNTLSFPEGARHWFPSFDHPSDRATQEVIATVRGDWRVLSNGRLVEERRHADGRATFHWRLERPHPTYLSVLVAGPYVVLEDVVGELPLEYWVYPRDEQNAARSFEKTPEIIEFLAETFGVPYPWSRYAQVTIPGIGGGAESTTATVLGDSTIHDAKADEDFPSHWLVAHEAAHHWWGNLVSYRAWQETWLSEGFATYSEYLYSRHSLGEDEGAWNLHRKKEAYLREARERYQRPIVFDRWTHPNQNFDGHTYPKAAAVIHMLRFVLGDAGFFRALTHFLEKHAYQAVQTEDLVVAIKESTGQNLDWFFEQWIRRPGHPVFDVSWTWDEASGEALVVVEQTQDSSGRVPVYRMPVDLRFDLGGSSQTERIWLEGKREEFRLRLPARPLLVRFDAGDWLLKEWTFEKSTGELLYQLENGDGFGRRWAATELGSRRGEPGVRTALWRAAESDAFRVARSSAIEALGPPPTRDETQRLKGLAVSDSHSGVRESALDQLGEARRADLAGFFKERFVAESSYVAQAAAVRALGRLADPRHRDFLAEAGRVASPRDVVASAAREALQAFNEGGW